jgi:hypothetical protein
MPMTADNPFTWAVKNGIGVQNSATNTVDEFGNITPQFAMRSNGAPVEQDNPLPIKPPPANYSNSIVVAGTVGAATGGEPLITSGGPPTGRFEFFNNGETGTIWINPAGGEAVVNQGIPIFPRGNYLWANGLAAIPTGISDNGTVATSGAGGY